MNDIYNVEILPFFGRIAFEQHLFNVRNDFFYRRKFKLFMEKFFEEVV